MATKPQKTTTEPKAQPVWTDHMPPAGLSRRDKLRWLASLTAGAAGAFIDLSRNLRQWKEGIDLALSVGDDKLLEKSRNLYRIVAAAVADARRRAVAVYNLAVELLPEVHGRLAVVGNLPWDPDDKALAAADAEWRWLRDLATHEAADATPPSTLDRLLSGTVAILEAVNQPPGESSWRRVKRLNEIKGGPIIIGRSGVPPKANLAELQRWWREQAAKHASLAEVDDSDRCDHEATAAHIQGGARRGAENLAAADEGLSVSPTRRTHLSKRKRCDVCGKTIHAGRVCSECQK